MPRRPDKFNTPKPHDLPDDDITNTADPTGPHGPAVNPAPSLPMLKKTGPEVATDELA